MVDFSKILSKQAAEIEPPKTLPVGTYLCNNPKLPDFKGIGKEDTPVAQLQLVVLSAQEDVDPAELAAFGEVAGKTIRHQMWLTESGEFYTKEELVNAWGCDESGTLGQMFNETINKQVLVTIKHRPSEDGTKMYVEVEKVAAA
jgi:alpha-ketoglutarate-dependent taurine dioxygenase